MVMGEMRPKIEKLKRKEITITETRKKAEKGGRGRPPLSFSCECKSAQ